MYTALPKAYVASGCKLHRTKKYVSKELVYTLFCRREFPTVTPFFNDVILIWQVDLPKWDCQDQGVTFRNGEKKDIMFSCGNPYTCINGVLKPSSYQCLWNNLCLNLNEKLAGRICIMDRNNWTRIVLQNEVDKWTG
ncbi:hypothetical protein PoB_006815700 [Plakobranchus ocellatus]|uniref:Uncharacterized protein n=1 Tax=Plakobranchus ocellatus TaxID=259542 RepID=A0AAV4DBQ7_9GAST|nr:hypothetical protein PoB_006815700 [Plakobranchus ocellatus]